jgi:hypothetical protein
MLKGELDQHKDSQLEEMNSILNDGYKDANIYIPHFLNILDIFKSIKDKYDISVKKSKFEKEYKEMASDFETCKGNYNDSFAELKITTLERIDSLFEKCNTIADFKREVSTISSDAGINIKILNDAYIKAQKDVLLKEYDYYVFLEENKKLSEEQYSRKLELAELFATHDVFGI